MHLTKELSPVSACTSSAELANTGQQKTSSKISVKLDITKIAVTKVPCLNSAF